jgi:hypothetical protein
MSPPPESTLADLHRANEDLRRQLAEQAAERDEALAREAAMAEVLGVINSSPGDLAPVVDAMLERALRLCEAAFGIMNTYDGKQYRAVATRGLPRALAQLLQTDPPPPGRYNPLRRVADGEELVQIVDFRADASYQEGNPRARALADMGDARSLAIVATRCPVPIRPSGPSRWQWRCVKR